MERHKDVKWGIISMIVYSPLWRTMEERNFTTYTLRVKHEISNSTVQRLKKDLPVSTNTLNMLCEILNCGLSDVAEYVPGKQYIK
jgi:DNA-binding Xre family transcriptional regulator